MPRHIFQPRLVPSIKVPVVLGCLPIDKDPAVDLQFLLNNKPLDGTVLGATVTSPLTYMAKPPLELRVGQTVKVFQSKPLQRDPDSPSQIVAAPPMPPTNVFGVQEGATRYMGRERGKIARPRTVKLHGHRRWEVG